MKLSKFYLYFNTIKYQNKKQLFYRLITIITSKYKNLFPEKYNSHIYNKNIDFELNDLKFFKSINEIDDLDLIDDDLINNLKNKYQDISNNKFSFLNQTHQFEKEINWKRDKFDDLWFFNLHYFDYLIDLSLYYLIQKDKNIYQQSKNIILSWINHNDPADKSWHPYVISLRVVNWIKYYLILKKEIEEDKKFKKKFLESIYLQLTVLYNNLEYHLGGNHLLENGKTLIFAGIFFKNQQSSKWFSKGMEIIKDSLNQQILSDGGNYERSPMYHSIVLKDYLEIIHLLKINNKEYNNLELEKIKKMVDYLKELSHPDGEIALFNDSALEIADSPSSLFSLAAAVIDYNVLDKKNFDLYTYLLTAEKTTDININSSQQTLKSFPKTGYHRISDTKEDSYLIFDCGAVGPDGNPGHAHADTLSYEFSYKKKRWLVDSGTYSYHDQLRNEFRATKAHNTVVIDDKNQSQVWSKFRVAKRAKAKSNFTVSNNDLIAVQGEHYGYQPLIHKRTVLFIKEQYWLIFDNILGSGKHQINNYLHFADDIKLKKIKDDLYLSCFEEQELYIKVFDNKEFIKDSFYYSPEFNIKKKNDVLIQKNKADLPAKTAYILVPGELYNSNQSLSFTNNDNSLKIEFANYLDKIKINKEAVTFERKSKE
jgi:uncharacterized heparinase superfamily protein